MDSKLASLFSSLGAFFNLRSYESEFETSRLLFDKSPKFATNICHTISLKWLHELEEAEDIEFAMKDDKEKIKESQDLRKEGNRLFNATGDKKNILGAGRLYNDAIFAAIETGGSELALAYANRAMALQKFGYYQQAYDDCVCALECGYPEAVRHKLVMRQAFCSMQLKNIQLLESHLQDLDHMTLNDEFRKQFDKLNEALFALKENTSNENNVKPVQQENPQSRTSQEIIDTASVRGRIMKAKRFIPKNNLIFTEKAPAFVPVGDSRRICHQCGIANFIPYPCLKCRGRVIYCSIKCKDIHRSVHDYECKGYRFQLFSYVGIGHLALRTVLDNGLLAIADELKTKSSTAEVWHSLSPGGDIWQKQEFPYAESLRMISHLDEQSMESIECYVLVSYLLVIYLSHYTTFFATLKKYNSLCDWELLTTSLLLRHFGQLITNGHTLTTIIARPLFYTDTDFHLLNDRIWSSPWHLKCGYLNIFNYMDDLATLNLPYLSICNHSCVQTFQPKFSGRYISTFALRDLKKGDEITNCYVLDYRKEKRESRREQLQMTFNFDCECEKCMLPEPDLDFNKYHQYRCDNKDCNQIFVPNTTNWWEKQKLTSIIDANVYCTKCGCKQRFQWLFELRSLLDTVHETISRRRLYKLFKSLESRLLGLNDARNYVAMVICFACVKLPYEGVTLNNEDYSELVDMVKYALENAKSQASVNSIEYLVVMTYLWDWMAIGKYKCSKAEMDEMLFALSIISDDTKVIFENYYNDFIKDKYLL